MREIKFRAWEPSNKTMYLTVMAGEPANPTVMTTKVGVWEECTPEAIIMQFTGLCDLNNKEIYEGDILKLGTYKYYFEVRWTDDVAGFDLYELKEFKLNYPIRSIDKTAKLNNGYWQRHIWEGLSDFEVIGNIYENPELLK